MARGKHVSIMEFIVQDRAFKYATPCCQKIASGDGDYGDHVPASFWPSSTYSHVEVDARSRRPTPEKRGELHAACRAF